MSTEMHSTYDQLSKSTSEQIEHNMLRVSIYDFISQIFTYEDIAEECEISFLIPFSQEHSTYPFTRENYIKLSKLIYVKYCKLGSTSFNKKFPMWSYILSEFQDKQQQYSKT